MDSKKSINSFKIKTQKSHDYLWQNYLFWQIVNNFSALLLYKIRVFDFFNIVDFFRFFLHRGLLKF